MRQGLKLVVLAGSAEARRIAQTCQQAGAEVTALVSEPPRGPDPMPVPCKLLDFSNSAAMTEALNGAEAIVDASHGFDAGMSAHGHLAARALGLPFISYQRPAWPVDPQKNTHAVADVSAAMSVLEPGARVFSAAGWNSLPACAGFRGERLFLRQTSPHDRPVPYSFVTLSFGTPPFDEAAERQLFKDLRIDTLLCRNLGGQASHPKVAAAQSLGLRVLLIARPALPEGAPVVTSIADAVDWVAAQ